MGEMRKPFLPSFVAEIGHKLEVQLQQRPMPPGVFDHDSDSRVLFWWEPVPTHNPEFVGCVGTQMPSRLLHGCDGRVRQRVKGNGPYMHQYIHLKVVLNLIWLVLEHTTNSRNMFRVLLHGGFSGVTRLCHLPLILQQGNNVQTRTPESMCDTGDMLTQRLSELKCQDATPRAYL